jgi:hypothetical protein
MGSTDWKTMDSAPKDGTKMLLYAGCKTYPDDKPAPVLGSGTPNVMQWKVASEYLSQADELIPSHWIEIPEFPR